MSEVKKVITATTLATKAMVKASADMQKTATGLAALTLVSEDLSVDIEVKSAELAGIESQTSDALRKAKAELDLQVLENEESVLVKLMNKRGLAEITSSELQDLDLERLNALKDNQEAIDKAVGKANTSNAIKYSAEKSKLTSDQAVETAQLKANITSLTERNGDLTIQVVDLKDMIAAEREARVSMAASNSAPVVNVQSGK